MVRSELRSRVAKLDLIFKAFWSEKEYEKMEKKKREKSPKRKKVQTAKVLTKETRTV